MTTIPNPQEFTLAEIESVLAKFDAAKRERTAKLSKVNEVSAEFRDFAQGSNAVIQDALSVFKASMTQSAPVAANGNGEHKASEKKARATKKVAAKRKPRQAYKIPNSDRVWKGYGPAPKELKALPKEQWVTA